MSVDVDIDVELLKSEIKKTYACVSDEPESEFIFPTGRAWAEDLGYPPELANVPEFAVESFAGVANPWQFGRLEPGERVLDLGSGAGTDSLVAAQMVCRHLRPLRLRRHAPQSEEVRRTWHHREGIQAVVARSDATRPGTRRPRSPDRRSRGSRSTSRWLLGRSVSERARTSFGTCRPAVARVRSSSPPLDGPRRGNSEGAASSTVGVAEEVAQDVVERPAEELWVVAHPGRTARSAPRRSSSTSQTASNGALQPPETTSFGNSSSCNSSSGGCASHGPRSIIRICAPWNCSGGSGSGNSTGRPATSA